MKKEKNYTVRICEDYVVRDPDKVKTILERVSKIISNSYIEQKRGTRK
jgi:competence transcription factor ComK